MIERVEIQNWKAFDERQVNFTPGLNLLLGRNATGKTTILDAIALALAGETSEASGFKFLIRDRRSPSLVKLILTARGRRISIMRSFSSERVGGAWLSENGTERKVTWDEATSYLEKALGAHRGFFKRIAYISEGATFRYLQDLPASALTRQIESLFGIDLLQKYMSDMRSFASSVRTERSEIEQVWTDIELPSDVSARLEAVSNNLAKLDLDMRDARSELQAKTRQMADLQRRKEIQTRVDALLRYLTSALKHDELDDALPVSELGTRVVKMRHGTTAQVARDLDDAKKRQNVADARLTYLDDLENVAFESRKALATHPTGQKCPVCKRPLEESHVKSILVEIKQEREKLKADRARFTATISTLQGKLEQLDQTRIEAERVSSELQTYARQLKVSSLGEMMGAFQGLDKRMSEVRNQLANLEERNEASNKTLKRLTEEKTKLDTTKQKAEQSTAARTRIVQLTASDFVSEIIVNSISEAVREQQKTNVSVIQDTLSRLWGRFKGTQETVEFLPDGEMFIARDGSRLAFQQLSGGEKTALLVLSHAIAARALSNLDFLVIDEPLEHLDIENRRSLLNFLVQSVSRRFVLQMIVSTFEESLTRKYLQESSVHAIYL
jgi:DNA repair exonuclease SbcCD ATPase subunit